MYEGICIYNTLMWSAMMNVNTYISMYMCVYVCVYIGTLPPMGKMHSVYMC